MSQFAAATKSEESTTLADLLEGEAVPFATLHEQYSSLLALVRTLIGVVPNCDRYLAIWPTAFRSYNVMVPNLLNMPFLAWGVGAPRAAVGLAMYTSSRAAGCPYCSAHACSFALRRGATPGQVVAAMQDESRLGAAERAVVRVARSLGSSTLPAAERAEFLSHYPGADGEWIVLAIAMMGWLTKFMSAIGVPLELQTVEEVNGLIAPSGWTPGEHLRESFGSSAVPRADSLATKLGILRHAPSAIALDKKWTKGVPDRWPAVGRFLQEKAGYDFPVLSKLRNRRAVRAIASMIADQFGDSVIGCERKLAAGLIYAEAAGAQELRSWLGTVRPQRESAVEIVARAVSPSRAVVDQTVRKACRSLPAAGVVEVVSFIALMQLLHRLQLFYGAE